MNDNLVKLKPFEPQKLEGERDQDKLIFTVKLNEEDRALLDQCKSLIEQPKDSTALKTLAWIGAKVILQEHNRYILELVFKNRYNNKRSGLSVWKD